MSSGDQSGLPVGKKPFNKKKWRENKYSNKAKSEWILLGSLAVVPTLHLAFFFFFQWTGGKKSSRGA